MDYVVEMQALENKSLGKDAKYHGGNPQWRFKEGTTYVVADCSSDREAMAFVMAAFSHNGPEWKEFPSSVQTVEEWEKEPLAWYMKATAQRVSPKTGRLKVKAYPITMEDANRAMYQEALTK